MNRKTLQTLEICLAAVSVGYIIFAIFAYGFALSTVLLGLLFGAYALLMRYNASKAAAVIAFVLCAYFIWSIVGIFQAASYWGYAVSSLFVQIILTFVDVTLFLCIGIAAFARVKNNRLISILIAVFGGVIVLYTLIGMVTMLIRGGTYSIRFSIGSLISAGVYALFALIAIGSLSIQRQTETDENSSVNSLEG